MDSDFMNKISDALCERNCEVIRFEFPYMQARRKNGVKKPPDNQAKLIAAWQTQINELRQKLPTQRKLIIGGKSLGGRIASLLADEFNVHGLVCFGYPFHPVAKPHSLRTEHLETLKTPTLFLQGTRDRLGSFDEVGGYSLSSSINLHWLADGDHDLKPRVKSGYSHQQHLDAAADAVVKFIQSL